MFTPEDYLYGWLLYILGGLIFFGCWWYVTAKIRYAPVRLLLRIISLVTMFVPWYADPALDYLAPAVVIAGMEGIFEGDGAFWRAGTPLLVALAISVAASLGYSLAQSLLRDQKKS